ncbi:thioester domain-containing protein, partial [Dorea longicatena]|uniref:thioester domain-containing protein n=1 Tax=Dorea longicatena TaxID=88431 RepID=UPI0024355399
MKVRKLKTRIAAFGLAVLMGISTLSSANAFAAEQTGSEQQTEVQASEQAVTSQKDTSVTADDITKAVSDDTFAVETSMEGIHYDAEKEDVTLVSIKDENGGEYHSDKAGTYIATYMVVPKDKSDSYTITRKVTLTDTEGQAHSEENGGEKQKSDTESEDDSDSPVQNYTDVEIETSEEDASAQAIKELKEDIEEGNVMVLSAAERATSSGSTVTLTKGRTIYYPSYIGNYLTCLFTVNGKIAYCLQSQKASPPSGSYVAQVLDSNKNLQKVLYYGYGGAGDLTGSYLSGKTEDEKYVYTHIAASYAYAGEAGFTGCNYNDLVNAGVTVKEQVKKQAFQLIKISEDGEQTETDLVAGAGFKVYLISDLTQVKNGKLKPANGESYTANDFKNYDFSKEQVAVTYENGTAVPVPELITDTKGYAVSPELPYGSYVVVESTTPENLKTIDPFVVNVENDSREPMQWRVFDDRPFEFLLKIVKKDAQTGNTVLKAGASYKIYDVTNKKYVEQVVQYPKKEKISVFKTNEEGYLITPQELKCATYRIEEVKAPEGFVRQGSEESLYDGTTIISPVEQTTKGTYKENPQSGIVITVSSNTAHQIDPDTGAAIVEVEQKNDEQVGSLLLTKKGEQLTEVTGDSVLEKVKTLVSKVKNAVSGKEETGIYKDFKYEETGVEGAQFEVYAKDTIYSPDGAKDEAGNPVVRYEKDDLVAKLTTDENGTAVINNLPLGTYYLKEVVAGENFVLNTEQKEFTLTEEDDTQAVVYEGVTYKNERQKVSVSVEKKDSVTGEKLEGVIFGLYAAEDILSNQGEVLVEKDTLLEKKATDT